ncbi:MAG: AI-2E family transporter [Chitinispirillales bacterium]|jgi:predicted PurR-regulated permease PerM|nr:AI-2E family transporter [Chitinispirillales bacterium]
MDEIRKIDYTRSMNRLLTILIIALGVGVLYAAKTFIIPFVVALIIFFVLINFENLISKGIKSVILFFTKKEISKRAGVAILAVSVILSLTISVFILFSFYKVISKNFDDMLANTTKYQMLFNGKIVQYNKMVMDSQKPVDDDMNFSPFQQIVSIIPESHLPIIDSKIIDEINFSNLFNKIGGFAGKSVANSALVLIYLVFLYGERVNFNKKFKKIREINPKFEKLDNIIRDIGGNLVGYFNIKTIVSFVTAALAYPVMSGFGLDFVWLWAAIIFILNYIPTIGSIVATTLPSVLGIIMFDSFIDAVFMAFILTTIQFIIGNVVEPKFQGDRLNLAPIMILLSLAIWGAIWGIVGMFLAVPIMVTINAALSQFETTKPLAMLFSSTGDIKN